MAEPCPNTRRRGRGRARRWRIGLALVGLGLAACQRPDPDKQPKAQPDQAQREADAEHLRVARETTFAAAIDAAAGAFRLESPLDVAVLERGPLEVPARSLDWLADTRAQARRARTEVADLDEADFAPTERMTLRTLRFGLDRLEDRLDGHPPARTDPNVAVETMERTLDELERRLVLGREVNAAEVLQGLGRAAKLWQRELVSGNAATAESAALRVEQLRARLARVVEASATLPNANAALEPDAASEADAALGELQVQLRELRKALPERRLANSREPVLVGMEDPPRTPARLGLEALERRLAVEEHVLTRPPVLLAGIERNLDRLAAMREAVDGDVPPSSPTPVTAARCEASGDRLEAALGEVSSRLGSDASGIALHRPRCDAWARLHANTPLDDAALDLRLLQSFVIVEARRDVRRAQHPVVALVAGDMAPWAQLHARGIALALAAGPSAAPLAHSAIDEARDSLCRAGAFLLVHAWDDPALSQALDGADAAESLESAEARTEAWLTRWCPHAPVDDWRDAALADPRAAARGLGFATFDDRPDVMAGLDHFWWAPLGLTYMLGHPEAPDGTDDQGRAAGDEPPLRVKLEPLGTEPAEPDTP